MNKAAIAFLCCVLLLVVGAAIFFFGFGFRGIYYSRPTYGPYPTIPLYPPTREDSSTTTITSQSDVVAAGNHFTFDLYTYYAKKETGNMFFSPFSISSALSMTQEGAKGITQEEMKKVLHLSDNVQKMHTEVNTLMKSLQSSDNYELKLVNDLWVQKDFALQPAFLSTIQNYYLGKVQNVDFKNALESSRQTINSAVAKATSDRIKDLVPENSLSQDTRLVLTNAIYFKAAWANEFFPAATKDAQFTLNSGEVKQVPTMTQTDHFVYTETDDLQMVKLPYNKNELSMLVILPKKGKLSQVESELIQENFDKWTKSLATESVELSLPKFKFETKYFMSKDLPQMGMRTAFTDQADFNGMTKVEALKISEVIHQTFIAVDEKGTEAAAATAVSMVATGAPMYNNLKTFTADHPFIFLIQHNQTGAILFVGRVSDPK